MLNGTPADLRDVAELVGPFLDFWSLVNLSCVASDIVPPGLTKQWLKQSVAPLKLHKLAEKTKHLARLAISVYYASKKQCQFCHATFCGEFRDGIGMYAHKACLRNALTNVWYLREEASCEAILSELPYATYEGYSRKSRYSSGGYTYHCVFKEETDACPPWWTFRFAQTHPASFPRITQSYEQIMEDKRVKAEEEAARLIRKRQREERAAELAVLKRRKLEENMAKSSARRSVMSSVCRGNPDLEALLFFAHPSHAKTTAGKKAAPVQYKAFVDSVSLFSGFQAWRNRIVELNTEFAKVPPRTFDRGNRVLFNEIKRNRKASKNWTSSKSQTRFCVSCGAPASLRCSSNACALHCTDKECSFPKHERQNNR